jgi:hypothetical protein
MSERTLDNSLPASAVEKGGFAATGYEFVPAGEIGWFQFANANGFARRFGGRRGV